MKITCPILALAMTILIVYLSSIPDLAILEPGSRTDQIVSNLAHIPAYGLLTFMWIKSFNGLAWHKSRALVKLAVLAGLLLFSVSDEFHQSFVPGRTASAMDVGLDLLGILLGLGVWRASASLLRSFKIQN